MVKIVIYTKSFCPFCHKAKALFDKRGVKYEEFVIENDPVKTKEMEDRSGRVTVPQIFIDDKHIGGCDDLYELEERGELDSLLG